MKVYMSKQCSSIKAKNMPGVIPFEDIYYYLTSDTVHSVSKIVRKAL